MTFTSGVVCNDLRIIAILADLKQFILSFHAFCVFSTFELVNSTICKGLPFRNLLRVCVV